jgi:opacity protein-like surface antigen
MRKLLVAIALIIISYSAAMAQNETEGKRQFQVKTYLSANYQGIPVISYRNISLTPPTLGLAWNNAGKSNFQELQLVNLSFSRANNNNFAYGHSEYLQLRYAYNFAFPIGEKWIPYIGAGVEQSIGNSNYIVPENQKQFSLLTSLIATPGVQYKLNNKWALDFNIPVYIAEYQFLNRTISDIKQPVYSEFDTILGKKMNFRLGVAYTF